jgi:hypothetical protein
MAIRRKCRGQCGCGRRCREHLWLDKMVRGIRYRMPVNDCAIPRMEPSRQRPVSSIEEARDWERLFIGEIKAGAIPEESLSPAEWTLISRLSQVFWTPTSIGRSNSRACEASTPSGAASRS